MSGKTKMIRQTDALCSITQFSEIFFSSLTPKRRLVQITYQDPHAGRSNRDVLVRSRLREDKFDAAMTATNSYGRTSAVVGSTTSIASPAKSTKTFSPAPWLCRIVGRNRLLKAS
jgi:hypothetical protein